VERDEDKTREQLLGELRELRHTQSHKGQHPEVEFCHRLFDRFPSGLTIWRLENTRDIGSFTRLWGNAAASSRGAVALNAPAGQSIREAHPEFLDGAGPALFYDAILSGKVTTVEALEYIDNSQNKAVFHGILIPLDNRHLAASLQSVTGDSSEQRTQEQHRSKLEHELHEQSSKLQLAVEELEHERAETENQRALLKRLQREDQEAQKLESLGALAGGIAHDFNNLLLGVLGYADLALRRLTPDAPAWEFIKGIKSSALKAAELCNQMLAYSGEGRFVIEPLSLNSVLEDMRHLLSVSMSKKISLKLDLAVDIPAIEADKSQLHQLILNLVINASEAIGSKNGEINIRTGTVDCDLDYLNDTFLSQSLPMGLYVSLDVEDTGCGISDDIYQKIFDPFFSTKFTGRGLGLSNVLAISRGHRGAVVVKTAINAGTLFRVLFPPLRTQILPVVSKAEDQKQSVGEGAILLVDDDDSVRNVVSLVLEEVGFSVITACNGLEALEIYKTRRQEFKCVLLDMAMPVLDGEETFYELKKIDPNVTVVLSSGYNKQDLINRFDAQELAGFVKKPYEITSLLEVLFKAMQ
jgi:signal transduction histidine kinase